MRPVNHLVEKFIPSALVFAIVLTFIVAVLALALTGSSPVLIIKSWGDGLAGLLAFMTQMALVLLLGYILANTGPVRRLLGFLGGIPRSPIQAYLFVFLVAAVASLITWDLGLVVGALLAKEVAAQGRERGMKLHFPMLVACGFAGFVVWHMGYSGSGPLTAATPDSFIAEELGAPLSISETTFSSWNMVAAVITIAVVALALFLIAPRQSDKIVELTRDVREAGVVVEEEVLTPADRVDASRLPTLLLVRHPFELVALTKDAVSKVGEILLQFPLYAGILGIMQGSGLIVLVSNAFVAISTPQTFGVLAFLSAGVVNFFVPSGGGQFAVQAPIMLTAAEQLGVDPSVPIMAVAYGDQWTNMIQPFWALPLLAIAGLKMRDILGYTTIVLIASGLVFAATLVIVSL
ncbi:short-chain fatty acid transporter [Arthrobacter rhombi]|uniref:short-chain fatty acid transporter n=1 Tax=Arthrobacter rhombi TaxID=71253 RepID=UPI003FD321BF